MAAVDKAQIKRVAPQGLAADDSKVRTAAAMLVARVAAHEWPEQVRRAVARSQWRVASAGG